MRSYPRSPLVEMASLEKNITYPDRFAAVCTTRRGNSARAFFDAMESKLQIDQIYLVDQRSDDPEQFRAIGWCDGRLCSVIFEIRLDDEGEYYHLIAAWKATIEEEQSYAENT